MRKCYAHYTQSSIHNTHELVSAFISSAVRLYGFVVLPAAKIRRNLAAQELAQIGYDNGPEKARCRFGRQYRVSERWLVAVGVRVIILWRGKPLLSVEFVERQLVMRPDAFAEVIEQLDDGLRLLGRPIGGDEERKALAQTGGLMGIFHDASAVVFLRRVRARCSAR